MTNYVRVKIDIENDLLEEMNDMAERLNTDVNSLIIACIKSHIIASDVFTGLLKKSDEKS